MRMTASWSSPQSRNSPNTRLWGDVRLTDRRFPSGRRAYPATVNRRSPDQVSVTPCSTPSRTLRAAPGGGPKGPSLTASARGVIGPGQVGTEKRPSGRTKKLTKPKKEGKTRSTTQTFLTMAPIQGWAKRSVPTLPTSRWARRAERAFAHPTRRITPTLPHAAPAPRAPLRPAAPPAPRTEPRPACADSRRVPWKAPQARRPRSNP
jgi:hypothetical protein